MKMRSKIGSLCLRYRRFAIALSQAMMIVLALQAAFLLRYDLGIPIAEIEVLQQALWVAVPVKMAVFVGARLHKGWWQFAGTRELLHIALGNVGASLAFAVVARAVVGPRLPRAVYLIDFLLCFLGTSAARFAVRLYNELFSKELRSQAGSKGLLIYGAGVAGRMLVHEIRSNPSLGYHVLGFIDDDPRKRSLEFMGVQVHGTGREAAQIVDRLRSKSRRVEEIIIAMPTANGRQMQEAIGNCRGAEVSCKTLPGIRELLAGQVLNKQIRDLSVDDLLGRQEVQLDEQRIAQQICGRVVLVTGAAGSIGSELCRQIARYNPAKIVAFDIAESELYKLDLELRTRFPQLDNVVEIGSICDGERMREVLRGNRVECVFHAAAYKHVPLMEVHVLEAVRNNVLGTWTLLEAARSSGVRNFLMISSDKAVNPVSVMGATKRAAELIVSSSKSAMTAVSVRFGNVLASNGSVLPLFQAQIAAGGPVKVTHPDICRYFMSLPEAAQLVLQAFAMGHGAEIFILDMGEPIKIVDLATNMIRLNGLKPGEDIEIRFTGLRQGERLHEELMTRDELVVPTYHSKIRIFRGPALHLEAIATWLTDLTRIVERRDAVGAVAHLQAIVPEYRPSALWAARLPATHGSAPAPRRERIGADVVAQTVPIPLSSS
jgi:FlaA1/EpsC-like NDP-sugar epimerase